jgi:dihydrofolate reductase
MSSRLSAIAAISSKNRAMGFHNELLWRIPTDLTRVRELTMGHPLIMGRKTMEHIIATAGGALKGRTNIVITRDAALTSTGFVIAHSLDEALKKASESPGGDTESFIFGGAQMYALALPQTHRLYLTVVEDEPEADAFFPDYSEFTKVVEKSEPMKFGEITYTYVTLERA